MGSKIAAAVIIAVVISVMAALSGVFKAPDPAGAQVTGGATVGAPVATATANVAPPAPIPTPAPALAATDSATSSARAIILAGRMSASSAIAQSGEFSENIITLVASESSASLAGVVFSGLNIPEGKPSKSAKVVRFAKDGLAEYLNVNGVLIVPGEKYPKLSGQIGVDFDPVSAVSSGRLVGVQVGGDLPSRLRGYLFSFPETGPQFAIHFDWACGNRQSDCTQVAAQRVVSLMAVQRDAQQDKSQPLYGTEVDGIEFCGLPESEKNAWGTGVLQAILNSGGRRTKKGAHLKGELTVRENPDGTLHIVGSLRVTSGSPRIFVTFEEDCPGDMECSDAIGKLVVNSMTTQLGIMASAASSSVPQVPQPYRRRRQP